MDGKAGFYFFIWINGITDSIQKRYINQTEILSVRPLQKHSSMTLDRHFLTVFFREDGLERFFGIDSRRYISWFVSSARNNILFRYMGME